MEVATGDTISQIGDVLSCEISMGLSKIGSFSVSLPVTEPKVGAIEAGAHEIRIHHEGEGEVFRGIVETVETTIGTSNKPIAVLSGPSVARELVWASTDLGLEYNGTSLATTVADLLTGTGWSAGTIASPANNVLMRIDARTVWESLVAVAKLFNYDVRERPTTRQIDIGAFGSATGIRAFNFSDVGPGIATANLTRAHYPLSNFKHTSDASDVITQIVPLGAGEGETMLTLEWANRSSPYSISTFTGPDGKTRYYIANNVGTYGARRKYMSWSDIIPLSNSLSGFRDAANALYDAAADKLTRMSSALVTMSFDVLGYQGDSGDLGNLMDVDYRGSVYGGSGLNSDFGRGPNNIRSFFNYKGATYIMDIKRSWAESGAQKTSVVTATARQRSQDGMAKIAELQNAITTVQVALKPYTYREIHNLDRRSLDSGFPATLKCSFDANIFLGLQYKLSFFIRKVRSNVTVAGSPNTNTSGASTQSSSQGSSATTTQGSNSASSDGGGAHNHLVFGNGVANNARYVGGENTGSHYNGASPAGTYHVHTHNHTVTGGIGSTVSYSSGDEPNKNHDHKVNSSVYRGRDSSGNLVNVEFVMPISVSNIYTYDTTANHSHPIPHTHNLPHTHDIQHTHSLNSHTHGLTYGIYEPASNPSPSVSITIDGVTVTGGPWTSVNTLYQLDVSSYIIDGNGQPKRSTFDIVFSSTALCDIEASLRSLVSATSQIPV